MMVKTAKVGHQFDVNEVIYDQKDEHIIHVLVSNSPLERR